MTTLSEKQVKSRKEHACDACYWFDRSNFGQNDLTDEEWQVVERVRVDGCKILPGMTYLRVTFTDGGEVYTFNGRLDMHEICLEYELYPED